MGQRGPKPASAAELLARGNVKLAKSRLVSAAPAVRPGVPEAPATLSPEARRAWHELTATLERTGQASPDWRAALTILCVTIGIANESYRRLSEALAGDADTRNVRKLTSLHARASADVLKWLKLFGLTPTSAAQMGITPTHQSSPSAPRSAPAVISRRGCAGLVGKNRRLAWPMTKPIAAKLAD